MNPPLSINRIFSFSLLLWVPSDSSTYRFVSTAVTADHNTVHLLPPPFWCPYPSFVDFLGPLILLAGSFPEAMGSQDCWANSGLCYPMPLFPYWFTVLNKMRYSFYQWRCICYSGGSQSWMYRLWSSWSHGAVASTLTTWCKALHFNSHKLKGILVSLRVSCTICDRAWGYFIALAAYSVCRLLCKAELKLFRFYICRSPEKHHPFLQLLSIQQKCLLLLVNHPHCQLLSVTSQHALQWWFQVRQRSFNVWHQLSGIAWD